MLHQNPSSFQALNLGTAVYRYALYSIINVFSILGLKDKCQLRSQHNGQTYFLKGMNTLEDNVVGMEWYEVKLFVNGASH